MLPCSLENNIASLALGQTIILRCLEGGGEVDWEEGGSLLVSTPRLASCRQDRLMSCGSRIHPGNDARPLPGACSKGHKAQARSG